MHPLRASRCPRSAAYAPTHRAAATRSQPDRPCPVAAPRQPRAKYALPVASAGPRQHRARPGLRSPRRGAPGSLARPRRGVRAHAPCQTRFLPLRPRSSRSRHMPAESARDRPLRRCMYALGIDHVMWIVTKMESCQARARIVRNRLATGKREVERIPLSRVNAVATAVAAARQTCRNPTTFFLVEFRSPGALNTQSVTGRQAHSLGIAEARLNGIKRHVDNNSGYQRKGDTRSPQSDRAVSARQALCGGWRGIGWPDNGFRENRQAASCLRGRTALAQRDRCQRRALRPGSARGTRSPRRRPRAAGAAAPGARRY